MSPLRLAGLLGLFAACAVDVAPDVELEPVFKDDEPNEPPPEDPEPCPPNGCGGNSPVVEGVYFGRLHSYGLANPEGVKITSVTSANGVPMTLHVVDNDRLQGWVINSTTKLNGTSLTGTLIHIDSNGTPGIITIASVTPTENFWVGSMLMIENYEFRYLSGANGGAEVDGPLCSEGDNDPNKISAIVFAGDLYDPVTKDITIGPRTANWFNIACVHSATYKMHKMGYTTAGQNRLGIATSLDERRSMLNAWTSNVCGTGYAFTHEGEPITLRESHALLPADSPYSAPSASIEAIWGPDGAVCLTTHRLLEENPEIMNEINSECGAPKPTCAAYMGSWQQFGYVLTGNPVGE